MGPVKERTELSGIVYRRLVVLLAACVFAAAGCSAGASNASNDSADSQSTNQVNDGHTKPATDELVVTSFGGSFADQLRVALIEPFVQETGINVELLNSQDDALTIAALNEGSPPPADISASNAAFAQAYAEKGYLEPIDYTVFSGDVLAAWPSELQERHIVLFQRIANVLCYDSEAIPDDVDPPSGWADFYDLETYPGGRSMVTWSADPSLQNALLADGVEPDDLYPLDIDRAFDKLAEIDSVIPTYADGSSQLMQLLLDGEIVMAQCFSHRMQALIDSGYTRGAMSFEQAEIINDGYVVWRDAPNRQNAMRFLSYIMEPENQARWATISKISPANPDAFDFMSEDALTKLPTSPENAAASAVPRNDDWLNANHNDDMTNAEYITEVRWPEFVGG